MAKVASMEKDSEVEEKSKPKRYSNPHLFEYLGNILVKKDMKLFENHVSDPSFSTSFPHLMVLRYLSMCRSNDVRTLVMENQIRLERLDKMSHALSYRWYLENVPKQRDGFIKYLK